MQIMENKKIKIIIYFPLNEMKLTKYLGYF